MQIKCDVKSVELIACNTYRVLLTPSQPVEFKAGQYLLAVMDEDDKRPFSIASSPCREGELELHIGAAEHNPYAIAVVEAMLSAKELGNAFTIEAPNGDAWLRDESTRPLLLIAGGTGFSYIRSILDRCLSLGLTQPIYVYWGGRDACQLYANDELMALAEKHENLHYLPVVEKADVSWSYRVGNVLQVVNDDFSSLSDYDIYLCGRFEMAGAARDQFCGEKFAQKDRMFADAFAFI